MTTNKTDLLSATYEVTIGKKATGGAGTRTFQVNLADFPVNAVEKIIAYGVQRIFNDKVGGANSTLDDKAKDIEALIERWKRGDIGRTPAQGVDAVTAEARKLIGAELRKSKPDVWKKLKYRDDKAEVLDKLVEANPNVRKRAEKNVADRAKATNINLGGLDI